MVADNQFFYDAVANRIVGTAWKSGAGEWPLTFDGFLEGSTAFATFNLGMLKPIIRTDFIHRAYLGYDEQARQGQDFFHLLQFYLAAVGPWSATSLIITTPSPTARFRAAGRTRRANATTFRPPI